MEGNFQKGLLLIPEIELELKNYKNRIDEHHFMSLLL